MQRTDLTKLIDLAVLAPNATSQELKAGLDLAVKYDCASLCVASGNLNAIRTLAPPGLVLCSVIGFPHGNISWSIKEAEAYQAIDSGATELDVVLNHREWCENATETIEGMRTFRRCFKHKCLKLILETCYLEPDAIERLSWYAGYLGWDYVKTSTGFGTNGAAFADIPPMRAAVSVFPALKIKASGGIKTREVAESFVEAGCSRLGVGVSGLKAILKGYENE